MLFSNNDYERLEYQMAANLYNIMKAKKDIKQGEIARLRLDNLYKEKERLDKLFENEKEK